MKKCSDNRGSYFMLLSKYKYIFYLLTVLLAVLTLPFGALLGESVFSEIYLKHGIYSFHFNYVLGFIGFLLLLIDFIVVFKAIKNHKILGAYNLIVALIVSGTVLAYYYLCIRYSTTVVTGWP